MRLDFGMRVAAIAALVAGPAFSGDAALGEKVFGKCKSCHAITAADGTVIQKGGKIGPDLFGVIGRTAGTLPDYDFGDDMIAAGVAGLVWDEINLAEYLKDPKAFLRNLLGSDAAKTKMTFKLAKGGEDVAAYLASLNPPAQ